ncbi:MAG: 23S rRNA (uracil(1939)-C(5))-methyltransferase RlmD [Planctomycetota bacterium]
MKAQTRRPRKGEELELTIERLDAKGQGVGFWPADGEDARRERVRVRGGLPGARLRVAVLRKRKGALDARPLDQLAPSPNAVPPRCPHTSSCGGCSLQELEYGAQLEALQELFERTLAPLLDVAPCEVTPIVGADEPFGYRNKMDFTFASRRWVEPDEPEGVDASFAVGLHVRGLYRKVLDVERCEIAFPGASAILGTARQLARERGLTPWDLEAHTGLLRHLVLRRSEATGEVLVHLVTSDETPAEVEPYARAILARHPEIATLVHSVSTRAATVAVGESERVLAGSGWIEERLAGLSFRVSAGSFFQTNTRQAERLAALVRERAGAGEMVYDLCCGAGALGLAVTAGSDRRLFGFELVPEAVADARWNAERNGLGAATFVEGDLAETLPGGSYPPPDVCLADPPRAGLHPKVVAELRRLAPPRLVYVSCNPAAAVRDLVPLVEDGYAVRSIEPLDLFPHTPHLECVVTLERP